MDELTMSIQNVIPWRMMFADDIVLFDETKDEVERKLELCRNTLETRGFGLNRSMSEYLECSFSGNGSREEGTITFDGNIIRRSAFFRYLGFVLQNDGKLDDDVVHRIKSGWLKCKGATGYYMNVAEMRMLRWMCGHTGKDKLFENRLRWFGYVIRRPIDAPVRMLEEWGAHRLVRDRERPKQTWIRVIENDMRFLGIGEDMTLDRTM
ncbi:hypothetical protein OROGR_020106 [Orobanche gracilis]